MYEAIISGILLGLAAGFSPGPLTVLVISTTLRYTVAEGLKVALAPLLTDAPLIALTVVLLSQAAGYGVFLGLVSLAGAGFVFYLGWGTLGVKGLDLGNIPQVPQSIRKGVLVNLLSPHPYLFWFTVGAPQMLKLAAQGWGRTAAFLIGFYCCLVGSKMLMAVLCGKARQVITGKPYVYTMRTLGCLLVLFAILLFKDGLKLLGLF